MNPLYPIYVISKGRWESRLTVKALEWMRCPYRIVVEPQEYSKYAAVIKPEKILQLPFSNLGQGSIPARNWVWEHSMSEGHAKHWICDDNLNRFVRLHNNLKIDVRTPTYFRIMEDFVDRYSNIALSGPQYWMFAPRKAKCDPIFWNTRIYSCILIRNDIPYRWRGRYNEDTDLSIRALKDGWATLMFYSFLTEKIATMLMKGGNTDELYKDDGRLKMAKSLQEQHPDIVKISWKWDRWQHVVDYRQFRYNDPKLKPEFESIEGINNYGLKLYEVT